MIQIVLIDDHELVRTGFRMILQQQPDMSICGEAASAEEGLRLIRSDNIGPRGIMAQTPQDFLDWR